MKLHAKKFEVINLKIKLASKQIGFLCGVIQPETAEQVSEKGKKRVIRKTTG